MNLDRELYCRILLSLLLVAGAFATQTAAQSSSVDPSFNAVPSASLATDTNISYFVYPDGKVLVYNAPTMLVNGQFIGGIFRLNADGTTDPTFTYCGCGGIGIGSAMVAPDGKIILAGTTSPNHAKMIRINSDGSLDNSFSVFFASSGSPGLTGASYTLNAIQPDGKVIATLLHWGNIQGTWTAYSMARYNVDGSVDGSFTAPPLDGGHLVSTSALIDLLPDGRFYLAISTGNHLGRSMKLSRRNANGTADTTFTEYSQSISGGFFIGFSDIAVTPDGSVLATGLFWPSMTGGPYPRNIFRFLSNGTIDPGFNPPVSASGSGVHLLPDGKILHSAVLTSNAAQRMMRLNADGSVDNTYVMDPSATAIRGSWQADGMHRPVIFATTSAGPRLLRLLENGAIDPNYNPHFAAATTTTVSIAQPDGKVVVGGPFTGMNGVARNRIARLNADGSLDTSFAPTGFTSSGSPDKLLLQPDGKILVVGSFSYSGVPSTGIIRINPDGSRDETFSATATLVNTAALQPDGKILIGGSFSTVNGTPRTRLARLTSTGALDTDFDVVLAGTTTSIFLDDILVQPDGKIMIGGRFGSVNGIDRPNVARVESNGTLDPTFNAPTSGTARDLLRQPDGKYIVNDDNARRPIRRHIDGSVDTSFTASTTQDSDGSVGSIRSLMLMPDGTLLIGGSFTSVNGLLRDHLARLQPNGMLDLQFTVGANSTVLSIAPYSTGKVMIAGSFLVAGNLTRFGIARVNVAPLVRSVPFDFDGDGRADISVVRPSTNRWYEVLSSTGAVYEETFGVAGDVLAPADFDGDRITDEAIYRPSNGHWWYRSSANGGLILNPFGGPTDIPRPSDFDGDGKADFVIFRPSNNTWYRFSSLTNLEVLPVVFGVAGDQPLVGDFDGDGKSDLAVFRPSNGDWWYAASSAGGAFRTTHWGQNGDIPVPADYDGDSRTDVAVFRPSDGGWYILNSGDGSIVTTAFGTNGDRPVAADYDGDGRADIAVFRPSTGIWYLLRSTAGFAGYQFGISTDVAIPGSLIP